MKEYIAELLNGMTVVQFAVYATYMAIGAAISWLCEYVQHSSTIKQYGGWKMVTWWKENWSRVALFVLAAFVCIVFMEEIFQAKTKFQSMLIGAMGGTFIDTVITAIVKRKQA